jgi:hypothetical protein
VRAANAQMPIGGGVPPKDHRILIVGSEIDVNVQWQAVREVVVIKGDAAAAGEIFQRPSHQFERPHSIEAQCPAYLLAFRTLSVTVVDRAGTDRRPAESLIVHLDQHLGKLGVYHASQAASGLAMLLQPRRRMSRALSPKNTCSGCERNPSSPLVSHPAITVRPMSAVATAEGNSSVHADHF